MNRAFLSVDLDYWCDHHTEKSAISFFDNIADLGLPVTIVESHEEMLPIINDSGCNTLYNVDFHSDIFGFKGPEERDWWMHDNPVPDEGQWGPYIEWRDQGCFWWLYPWLQCYDGAGACWAAEGENPFTVGHTEWHETRRRKGTNPVNWGEIYKVAVCVSPNWVNFKTVSRVADALKVDHECGMLQAAFEPYKLSGREFQGLWERHRRIA